MRLIDAARYFDRTPCTDAYAPADPGFLAQLDLFDDSKRDGATVGRRVLSVAGDVVLPARGAVAAHDDVYIVGGVHKDSALGSVIRQKYVCHKADELALIRTLDGVIRNLTGLWAYGARLWVKDMKEVEVSSRLTAFFNLYFAPSETVGIGDVVSLGGRLHLVRNAYISAAGFLLCEADELPDDTLATVPYTGATQVYDPATNSMGGVAPVSVPLLWHRFQSSFDYLRPAAEAFEPGDITGNVSKASVATAATGDTFTLKGDSWRVLDARDSGDNVWILHARRV